MKKSRTNNDEEMRPEYDFAKMRGGVRGKHARDGARVVLVQLDADVAAAFPTADAVNEALRGAMKTRSSPASGRRATRTGTARSRAAQN
jgi:uncharacterized protein (DUF4415 family)